MAKNHTETILMTPRLEQQVKDHFLAGWAHCYTCVSDFTLTAEASLLQYNRLAETTAQTLVQHVQALVQASTQNGQPSIFYSKDLLAVSTCIPAFKCGKALLTSRVGTPKGPELGPFIKGEGCKVLLVFCIYGSHITAPYARLRIISVYGLCSHA